MGDDNLDKEPLPADRLPADRLPADRLPADRLPDASSSASFAASGSIDEVSIERLDITIPPNRSPHLGNEHDSELTQSLVDQRLMDHQLGERRHFDQGAPASSPQDPTAEDLGAATVRSLPDQTQPPALERVADQRANKIRSNNTRSDKYRSNKELPDLDPPAKQSLADPSSPPKKQLRASKSKRRMKNQPLPTVDGYEILEVLGQGSMGVVYKAKQVGLKRLVALKMILAGSHAGGSELARFKTEAEAVARLHHPNIVQVHEIGQWKPESGGPALPYLSIEYVSGGSLSRFLKGNPQRPRLAADMVKTLAMAVQYAHEHNVVHRDLKPANILIDGDLSLLGSGSISLDSKQLGSAITSQSSSSSKGIPYLVPKIADFGLAKQLDDASNQTMSGAIMGTPSYMAPEQAYGRASMIGPSADVYSLGAILYEMLTGRPPFKSASVYETLEQVRNQEPVPPSQFQSKTPIDLETICLKCLQKDSSKRYATALELAEDLGRFLADVPILARPVGTLERTVRWCRRNPFPAWLITGIACTLILGSIFSTYFGLRALRGEYLASQSAAQAKLHAAIAETRKLESDHRTYVAEYVLAWQRWQEGRIQDTLDLLNGLVPVDKNEPDLRGFEWNYLHRLCNLPLRTFQEVNEKDRSQIGIMAMSVSSDEKRIATAGHQVLVWDRLTGQIIRRFEGAEGLTYAVAISPDGKRVAAGGVDKKIHLWDVESGQQIEVLEGHTAFIRSIMFHPNRQELASAAWDHQVMRWDLEKSQRIDNWGGYYAQQYGLAYSPDGKQLFAACRMEQQTEPGSILVINVEEGLGKKVASLGPSVTTDIVVISRNGKTLASYSSLDRTVRCWEIDAADFREASSFAIKQGEDSKIAISPDGKKLAIADGNGILSIREVASQNEKMQLRGHSGIVLGLCFSSDGWQLLSAGVDGKLLTWDANHSFEKTEFQANPGLIIDGSLSSDGRFIAILNDRGGLEIFRTNGTQQVVKLDEASVPNSIQFIPNTSRLLMACDNGKFLEWDADARTTLEIVNLGEATQNLGVSHDGKLLATVKSNATLEVIRINDRTTISSLKLPAIDATDYRKHLQFHPQRPWIAVNYHLYPFAFIWDYRSGEMLWKSEDRAFAVAFTPDGSKLAHGQRLNLIDLDTWNVTRSDSKRNFTSLTLRFDHTGKRLIAQGRNNSVAVIDVATSSDLLLLQGHRQNLVSAQLSVDSSILASVGQDGLVQVWDARPASSSVQLEREVLGFLKFLEDSKLDSDGKRQFVERHPFLADEVRSRVLQTMDSQRIP